MSERAGRRLLILASKLGYQTRSFAAAAQRLGIEVALGRIAAINSMIRGRDRAIALHFERPEEAAAEIVAGAAVTPLQAILALGDRPTPAAARAARAARHCATIRRNRWTTAAANCGSAKCCSAAGLPVPAFYSFALDASFEGVPAGRQARARVKFPCVLKPLRLAASQGVIRANNAAEFRAAAERIRALLESPELRATREPELDRLLVEEYIPGRGSGDGGPGRGRARARARDIRQARSASRAVLRGDDLRDAVAAAGGRAGGASSRASNEARSHWD